MNKENKIKLLAFVVLAGFSLSVAMSYIMGAYLNAPHPYDTFLVIPSAKFNDFFETVHYSSNLNPYLFRDPYPAINYFPFDYVIGFVFSIFSPGIAFTLFLILSATSFLYFNITFFRTSDKTADFLTIFILTFLSYPLLLAIDRGNFEIILFLFLGFFLIFYIKDKWYLCAVFLGAAIAMKAFPVLLLILFIYTKKYKEAAFCITVAFLLNFIPLLFFQGGPFDNFKRMYINMRLYMDTYAVGDEGLDYGCSLFGMIKAFLYQFNITSDIKLALKLYNYFALIAGVLIIGYLIVVKMPLWKKAAVIVILMLLLTPVSASYKLLSIFIPIYLFVREQESNKGDTIFIIIFSLLLIPKNIRFIHSLYGGVIIDPILMLGLLVLLLSRYGEAASPKIPLHA